MKRVMSLLSGIVLLVTVGVGTASADPINKNSRYLTVNCNGEILDIVTESGSAAQILADAGADANAVAAHLLESAPTGDPVVVGRLLAV